MKKCVLLVVSMLLLLSVFGCSDNSKPASDAQKVPPELKNIALREKDWLAQLQPISAQIRSDFALWEDGQITREQLTEKLSGHKLKVKELRDQSDQYYLGLKLTEEIKKHPDYDKGLYYGQSLRLNVYSFLFNATNSAKPLTDQELKDSYKIEMEEGYNRKLTLLQTAIDKLTK